MNEVMTMEFGACGACRGAADPVGITCGHCGNHFHAGAALLERETPIPCPRCEGAVPPAEIAGARVTPIHEANEKQIIDLVCAEVTEPVAKAIRKVAQTRSSTDPNFWANVMLRESWRQDHGNYQGWDATALAGGMDPTAFGPA